MSILIIANGLSRPSTLWMRRQLDMISDQVTYLLTDPKSAHIYKKDYNVIIERQCRNNYINKILHIINSLKLFIAVHNKNVDVIFIHYATVAVRYKKALATTNKNIVVHCHGYDVTWDKHDIISGISSHGKTYVAQIKSMPKNVRFIANSKRTMQRLTDIGIDEKKSFPVDKADHLLKK